MLEVIKGKLVRLKELNYSNKFLFFKYYYLHCAKVVLFANLYTGNNLKITRFIFFSKKVSRLSMFFWNFLKSVNKVRLKNYIEFK